MVSRLECLRDEVEIASKEILTALAERARGVGSIAAEKTRLGLPMRDRAREERLLSRMAAVNPGPLSDEAVRRLFQEIIDACVAQVEAGPTRGLLVGREAGPPIGVRVGRVTLGQGRPVYVAGPCAVEDPEQMDRVAEALAQAGVGLMRGGAFKPRTSPYAFQGLGRRGLELLREAARRHGLATVTEATSPENVGLVAEYADMIQIGARNMYNYELLKAAGATGRPVLLKRAFSATIDEWVQAAEYIALAGSDQIVLCERGVRGFARETRNTLDLSAVPLTQGRTRLPVLVDVSHAVGRRDLLVPLTRAAFAVGAAGVMLEVHPDPDAALSDAEQQLSIEAFAELRHEVARGLGRVAVELLEESPSEIRGWSDAAECGV